MQRRAAAVYFALFVLIGAGAFGFIQVGTTQPDVRVDAPVLASGDSVTINGEEYTLTGIEAGVSLTGTLEWTNESAVGTLELENGSTTPYDGGEFTVTIENRTDVGAFGLVEAFNVTARLQADQAVENQLATINETEYVVYRANQTIVRLSEWLPEPTRHGPFAEGSSIESFPTDDGNVTVTVRNVTAAAATLAWDRTANQTVELTEGSNATLGGDAYFAHFIDDSTVQVANTAQHWDAYQAQLTYESAWFERHAGLWAVVIASFLTAILLLGAAYMPVRG